MKTRLSYLFDDGAPSLHMEEGQLCQHDQCVEKAAHRAPKNRTGDYFWFCLEHVRHYNATWNYYQDIPDEELESFIKDDVTWQRPTWSLYAKGLNQYHFINTYDFDTFKSSKHDSKKDFSSTEVPASTELNLALALFDLGLPFTKEDLKKSHRKLVKMYHPDVNEHPAAENMMRKINHAYKLLKKQISPA